MLIQDMKCSISDDISNIVLPHDGHFPDVEHPVFELLDGIVGYLAGQCCRLHLYPSISVTSSCIPSLII